ncbi:MAG: PP2C family protein-serine/threonine phosphatase [Clostridia bacterium]|nr:PP2C family protein-serine/threonine phosphatase [Clostridia bacterium]
MDNMKKTNKMRSSMSVNIIGAIVAVLFVFGIVVSTVGYVSFTDAFKKEYAESTYHMADTAALLVNGDSLEDYLADEKTDEYLLTRERLDAYCKKMGVSLIYVILVDTSDYGRFVSVFNSVDNTVDDSEYTPWELGHRRDTTNDEYRRKYKEIYDGEAVFETVYRTSPTDGQHPHITTMVPVKNSSGEVAAILCMQRPMRQLVLARRPYLVTVAVSTLLLALFASVFAAFYIRNQFVDPVKKVAKEASRFAKENTKGEPLSNISKYRVIHDLADSIDTMESDMVRYIDNLTSVTAEKERIGAELSLAGAIQRNSVPNDFPAFPDRSDFDICASMTPAKETGGDLYNFFLTDADHLAVVIGDVSGKGVPAALFMMVTNILIADRTYMGGTPAEILSFVNNNICEHNKADMFVTLWLGILELSTGRLTFANAGHDDAAVCRKDGSFELFKTKHSLVVGAMPDIKYRDFELTLEAGDRLFLYTDGVPEATDENYAMYSIGRMLAALNENKDKRPEEILTSIHESVNAFVGGAPQFDDLTMLCLEIKERGETRSGENAENRS